MEHDMAGPESETDAAKALIDKAIAMVGFGEAERLFRARKPKNKRGRSDYVTMDIRLIWLAGSLQKEWRECLGWCSPHDKRLPTPRALATKIVDLLWEDHDSTKLLRKFWGLSKCLKDFGADKKTVIQRLLDRDAIHWMPFQSDDEYLEAMKDYPEFESVRRAQARKAERAKGSVDRGGLLEAVHRQRPDLRLLPEKTSG
jgi:hypothetical protein